MKTFKHQLVYAQQKESPRQCKIPPWRAHSALKASLWSWQKAQIISSQHKLLTQICLFPNLSHLSMERCLWTSSPIQGISDQVCWEHIKPQPWCPATLWLEVPLFPYDLNPTHWLVWCKLGGIHQSSYGTSQTLSEGAQEKDWKLQSPRKDPSTFTLRA